MAKTQTKRHKLIKQFIEYCISGGAQFWSGYALFFVVYHEFAWSLWWAKQAANVFGWIINFFLERFWVFKNPHLEGHLGVVTRRYITITLVQFIIDYGIVYGLQHYYNVSPYYGQFVSAGFFVGWNYLWYRFWVFPERYKPKKRRA